MYELAEPCGARVTGYFASVDTCRGKSKGLRDLIFFVCLLHSDRWEEVVICDESDYRLNNRLTGLSDTSMCMCHHVPDLHHIGLLLVISHL